VISAPLVVLSVPPLVELKTEFIPLIGCSSGVLDGLELFSLQLIPTNNNNTNDNKN
jgi:hypothetical protein